MVPLKRSWIKPGIYPVTAALEFKFENTQEFHDQYVKLKTSVQQALATVQDYADDTADLNNNEQRPLYRWSDDDFHQFIDAAHMMHQLDNDEVKLRFKQLLIRDSMNSLQVVLQQMQQLANTDVSKFVGQMAEIKRLTESIKGGDVYVSNRVTGMGFDRLRSLSKLLSEQTSHNKLPINIDAELKLIKLQPFNNKGDGANHSAGKDLKNEKN